MAILFDQESGTDEGWLVIEETCWDCRFSRRQSG